MWLGYTYYTRSYGEFINIGYVHKAAQILVLVGPKYNAGIVDVYV